MSKQYPYFRGKRVKRAVGLPPCPFDKASFVAAAQPLPLVLGVNPDNRDQVFSATIDLTNFSSGGYGWGVANKRVRVVLIHPTTGKPTEVTAYLNLTLSLEGSNKMDAFLKANGGKLSADLQHLLEPQDHEPLQPSDD